MARKRHALIPCLALSTLLLAGAAAKPKPTTFAAMDLPFRRPSLSGQLGKVLAEFTKRSGIPLEADWQRLKQAGVKKTDPLAINISRATARQMLDSILSKVSRKGRPLSWYIDGTIVRVTTRKDVLTKSLPSRAAGRTSQPGRTKRSPGGGTIEFDETPLFDAIQHFRDIAPLNIHVNWRSLQAVGIRRETLVTLKASNVTLGRALRMVLDDVNSNLNKFSRVYWIIDGGVVTIATGDVLNRKLVTRVYHVADMLAVVPDFDAPKTLTDPNSSDNRQDDEQDEKDGPAGGRRRNEESLIAIIKDAIGQDMWQPIGKGSIRIMKGQLIVTQTQLGFKLFDQVISSRK